MHTICICMTCMRSHLDVTHFRPSTASVMPLACSGCLHQPRVYTHVLSLQHRRLWPLRRGSAELAHNAPCCTLSSATSGLPLWHI
jgi:hypothetical protein